MKLVVGLGNPGLKYTNSKHNIGFSVLKVLAKAYKIPLKSDKGTFSLSGKGRLDNHKLLLAMPLTFMNLSGQAIKALLEKYKIDLADLLVICDDLDLELGRLKIKDKGSSGGHRGLDSIIKALNTRDFCRLRIGINRPPKNIDAALYVLSPFSKKEKGLLREVIEKAGESCKIWIKKGIIESMNITNSNRSIE